MIKTVSLSFLFLIILTITIFELGFPIEDVDSDVVEDEKTKLLYFGATWCTPCIEMKKLFKNTDVKKELDKYDFIMYDYDLDIKVAEEYNIQYLPTMVFERGGKIIHRIESGLGKEELLKILKEKSS